MGPVKGLPNLAQIWRNGRHGAFVSFVDVDFLYTGKLHVLACDSLHLGGYEIVLHVD